MTKDAVSHPVSTGMRDKLRAAFPSASIDIIDESHLHKGHAGAREGGESHFRVRIIGTEFAGLRRLERQRRVHAVLATELEGPVHALSLQLLTPEEASRA